MAHHVSISEVHNHHVEATLFDGFDDGLGDSGSAHLRLQIIGRDFGRRHEQALLTREWLLHTAVEKVCDVRVFFRLRHTKIAEIQVAHHISQNIRERLRWYDDRQRKLLVVLRHADVVQVLRYTITRNCRIEVLSPRQITASLRI